MEKVKITEKKKAKMIERKKNYMSMKDKTKMRTMLECLHLITYLKYLDHNFLKNKFKTVVNPLYVFGFHFEFLFLSMHHLKNLKVIQKNLKKFLRVLSAFQFV